MHRNIERFEGDDFMFELTKDELSRCHFGILKAKRGQNIKFLPFAFTELGVAMLSSVLKSTSAIKVNREIMRAFVTFRHLTSLPNNTDRLSKIEYELEKIRKDMNESHIINLPKFLDARGNLSFVEQNNHIPFGIQRTYWIYDVPGGEERWGRAFKECEEFIISLSGSFDVILDDGLEKKTVTLDNFSTNSVALVMASTKYDEGDYIRDYDEFLKYKQHGKV